MTQKMFYEFILHCEELKKAQVNQLLVEVIRRKILPVDRTNIFLCRLFIHLFSFVLM